MTTVLVCIPKNIMIATHRVDYCELTLYGMTETKKFGKLLSPTTIKLSGRGSNIPVIRVIDFDLATTGAPRDSNYRETNKPQKQGVLPFQDAGWLFWTIRDLLKTGADDPFDSVPSVREAFEDMALSTTMDATKSLVSRSRLQFKDDFGIANIVSQKQTWTNAVMEVIKSLQTKPWKKPSGK